MNKSYSYEWDKKYCYPNSSVLKNKFNIKNDNELEIAEREYTSLSIAEIKINPIRGDFNLKHLQDIHKHVFKDIYSWAGEFRTVNILKGTSFCNYLFLIDMGNEIFSKLKREHYLIGVDRTEIYYKLSYYLSEINALHPFREGNGRVQRIMIEYLAKVAGYELDFSHISEIEIIKASIDSFNCDLDKMIEIFKKITTPIEKVEQEEFINKISCTNSEIKKTYNLIIKNKPLE